MNKALRRLINDLIEVRAYRSLTGVPIGFVKENLKDIKSQGEDAYYKVTEQSIIDRINDIIFFDCGLLYPDDEYVDGVDIRMTTEEIIDVINYVRENSIMRYREELVLERNNDLDLKDVKKKSFHRKREDKKRLKHMIIPQYDDKRDVLFYKRYYISDRKKYAKKRSNKKVRRYRPYTPLKGADYRKVYDYWWEIY